jgi:HD-GYP domain-containing protein (c-di-GMP phosphodiesterase class II)
VAYEHHIQYDGEGYPEHKTRRDCNLASMITFISNSYDNLRRERSGHKVLSLTDTLNWMDQRVDTHYHPLLYKKFRAMVKAQVNQTL